MGEFNWQQAAAQAAKGDREAFGKLYEQTERMVYFTCLKLLGNEHDAKDVMQDTYIKAFEKLSELSDQSKFPEWINRIAINGCKMHFRKQRPVYLEDEPEQAAELVDDNEIIPSDYVTDAAKRHIIMNIIDTQLSDVQRQTIILYYYDEISVAEISEIMECPEGTVKYRLSAAREKIREAVLIYENENDDKLHALMPVPVLTSILRKESEETIVPKIQLFKGETSSSLQGSGSNTITKGKIAMTKAIKVKIIAMIAAVVVIGGGIAAAIVLGGSDKPKTSDDTSVSQPEDTSSAVTDDSKADEPSVSGSAAEDSSQTEDSEEDVSSEADDFPDDYEPQYEKLLADIKEQGSFTFTLGDIVIATADPKNTYKYHSSSTGGYGTFERYKETYTIDYGYNICYNYYAPYVVGGAKYDENGVRLGEIDELYAGMSGIRPVIFEKVSKGTIEGTEYTVETYQADFKISATGGSSSWSDRYDKQVRFAFDEDGVLCYTDAYGGVWQTMTLTATADTSKFTIDGLTEMNATEWEEFWGFEDPKA